MKFVKSALGTIAALVLLVSIIPVLQDFGLLPGGFMGREKQWIWVGVAVVAAAILVWTLRTPGVWKAIAASLGVLMLLLGGIWILQGINVLPGSFMTGHMEWAYRGAGVAVVGAVLLWLALSFRRSGSESA